MLLRRGVTGGRARRLGHACQTLSPTSRARLGRKCQSQQELLFEGYAASRPLLCALPTKPPFRMQSISSRDGGCDGLQWLRLLTAEISLLGARQARLQLQLPPPAGFPNDIRNLTSATSSCVAGDAQQRESAAERCRMEPRSTTVDTSRAEPASQLPLTPTAALVRQRAQSMHSPAASPARASRTSEDALDDVPSPLLSTLRRSLEKTPAGGTLGTPAGWNSAVNASQPP